MTELQLDLRSIQYQSNDDTWRLVEGRYMNAAGDGFVIVAGPRSATSATATVIFNGLPVFVVIGDKIKTGLPDFPMEWRWAWPVLYVEPEDIEQLLRSDLFLIGELGTQCASRDEVLAKMMKDLNRDGWSVDRIYEEYGGEGHGTVAFVGLIATALHERYPNETPGVEGF